MNKVIIAGGRDFEQQSHKQLMFDSWKNILKVNEPGTRIEIVSGCARGADSLAIELARVYKYPVHKFPADWDSHGKSAGFIRNREMAQFADALLAFWDTKSRGTANMISEMQKLHKPVYVVRY